jgi:hypothetical protein
VMVFDIWLTQVESLEKSLHGADVGLPGELEPSSWWAHVIHL